MLSRITGAIRVAARSGPTGPTDAELLDRFRHDRDAEAFAALVRRHGRTVLAACRPILSEPADIDDTFQAAFLVLFRKVAAIDGATVGSWLYAVAHRLAVRARSDARRRAEREAAAARQRTEGHSPEPSWRDAVAVLHEELDRLPDAYRRVLLLCYLRGLSREEAAADLGWSPGAVKGRLERGRKMLAARLARRGIGLSAGALALVTGNSAGAGGPPPGLIEQTIRAVTGAPSPAVTALAHGVLTMPSVLRAALACAAVGLAALIGFGFWQPNRPPAPTRVPPPAPVVAGAATALEGRWRCVGMESEGEPALDWDVEMSRLVFTFEGSTFTAPKFAFDGSFALPAAPANAIDIHFTIDNKPVVMQGLFSRTGDTLKLCLQMGKSGEGRPTGFTTRSGDDTRAFVFKKIDPNEVRAETAGERLGAVYEVRRGPKNQGPENPEELAARCVSIARDHPGTPPAVVALMWVLANAPDGPSGKAALAALTNGEIAGADLETLAWCTGINRGSIGPGSIPDHLNRELAAHLLARVRRTPGHPKAAALLSTVCSATGWDAPDSSPVFDEAARMIAERWVTSPDLSHFLETLVASCQRPWAGRYEPTVRAIRNRTPNSHMRHRAAYTLAKLVAEAGEARQEEARELYARFVKEADPASVAENVRGLVEDMVELSRQEIDAMLVRGIGGPAPPLKGVDLDGKPMDLAEFRGKVVLLSFWGSWCAPCLRLVPHERALLEQHKGRPFALIGVNGDAIEKLDRKLLTTHKITWRSFQDARPNQKSISDEWNLTGWPELYLIDHTGTIRRRWIGAPPGDELDREVERWVAAAGGKPLAPAARPADTAPAPKPAQGAPAKFIDKVHTDAKGVASKYAVCVPESYDPKVALPVVLFLHGSGQVGTDNKKQLGIGFGPAVRTNGMPFPFVGVFPQAQDPSWEADSADGKRALAILEAVEREYGTDPRRVYLTGVSMGGEGVWSLAAAHPERFAAIVPVCGGGDPKRAGALKDLPCWAFHGDSDTTVPVGATRDMVRAVTRAGGRPQYQEYRGVDHNCWDRAYAEPELYLWLRAQALK